MDAAGIAQAGWPARDERRHEDATVEEWAFSFWSRDAGLGGLTWLRLLRPSRRAWYWSALVRPGQPLLHLAEWEAPLAANGLAVRADGLWADHVCEAPFEQWTIANEAYAVALDDPEDALGTAYGGRAPMAFDLEWYATALPEHIPDGYRQDGEVHGLIELGEGGVDLDGLPATRTHRWGATLAPLRPPPALAHRGGRAPVRLPTGEVLDLVLTGAGWRTRPGG